MAKYKRVFKELGNNLGDFPITDLEPFDLTFSRPEEKSNSAGGSLSTVVPPPPNPEEQEQDSNNGSGGSGSGSGNSQKQNNQTSSSGGSVNPFDQKGNQSRDFQDNQSDQDSQSGQDGQNGQDGSQSEQSGQDGSQSEQSGQDGSQSGHSGQDGSQSGQSGQNGSQSGQNSQNGSQSGQSGQDGSQNGQSGQDGQNSQDGSQSGQSGQSGKNGSQSKQDGQSGSQSGQSGQSGQNGSSQSGQEGENHTGGRSSGQASGENRVANSDGRTVKEQEADMNRSKFGEDEDASINPEDILKRNGITNNTAKGINDLNNITKDDTIAQKQKEQGNAQRTLDKTSKSQAEQKQQQEVLKDTVEKASKSVQEAQSDKNNQDAQTNSSMDAQIELMSGLGASSLSRIFNPKSVADWKTKLNILFKKALGYDTIINPNLVNKRIKDAPPGREDLTNKFKLMVVALDCSGSMGADKFRQVIIHINTMLHAMNLSSVRFMLVAWGSESFDEIFKTMRYVRGKQVKSTLLTNPDYTNCRWGTSIEPLFTLLTKKAKKPDAVFIMTDGEIWDSKVTFSKAYCHKNADRIIWCLPKGGSVDSFITKVDPKVKTQGRFIKFSGK